MEQIGKVTFFEEDKVIIRKPTSSNLMESGSDNDIYLGNMSQANVVKLLESILDVNDLNNINGNIYCMDFYQAEVKLQFNINNQNRISFRIQEKERLFGMITYCNNFYGIELDKEKIKIKIDLKNNSISFIN